MTLIKILKQTVGQEIIQTVNARELHAFLEIGKKFADWITERINKYNLLENQDFVCFPILGSKGRGGHNRKDYHLTLSVAKELSMLENNKKGREARLYFIECEKRLKQVTTPQVDLANALENPLTIKQLLLESINQLEDLRNEVSTLKPKAEALEGLKRSEGAMCGILLFFIHEWLFKELFEIF